MIGIGISPNLIRSGAAPGSTCPLAIPLTSGVPVVVAGSGWYTFTVTATGTTQLNWANVGTNGQLLAYLGGSCASLPAASLDTTLTAYYTGSITATAGQVIRVRIIGGGDTDGVLAVMPGVVAEWHMDESSGNRSNSVSGAAALPVVGSVGSTTGDIFPLAANGFSNSNYFQMASATTYNSLFNGSTSFTIAVRAYITGNCEYFEKNTRGVFLSLYGGLFYFGNNNAAAAVATNGVTGRWTTIIAQFNSDTGKYGIRADGGPLVEATISPSGTSSALVVGNRGAHDSAMPAGSKLGPIRLFSRILTTEEQLYALPPATPPASAWQRVYTPPASPVKLIIDTDNNTDCGDGGAIALAHGLMTEGDCEIIGVMVNVSNPDAVGCADAINAYHGRGSIPIGRYRSSPTVEATGHAMIAGVVAGFPNDANPATVPDAVTLYRTLLAAADNNSVVIAAIGFFGCLRDLLNSAADGISPLTGSQLITAKVRRLVCAAGVYDGTSTGLPNNAEYNFYIEPTSAATVVANWPGPIDFIGFELGLTVFCGNLLQALTPTTNPTRYLYEQFGKVSGRESWDQHGVWYAVKGSGDFVTYRGTNSVNSSTGVNTFTESADGPHTYSKFSHSGYTLAWEYNRLMVL
jgi:inosine-uridine nucleoside N-ribohydrolase